MEVEEANDSFAPQLCPAPPTRPPSGSPCVRWCPQSKAELPSAPGLHPPLLPTEGERWEIAVRAKTTAQILPFFFPPPHLHPFSLPFSLLSVFWPNFHALHRLCIAGRIIQPWSNHSFQHLRIFVSSLRLFFWPARMNSESSVNLTCYLKCSCRSHLFYYIFLGKSTGKILTAVNLLANRPTAHLACLVKDLSQLRQEELPSNKSSEEAGAQPNGETRLLLACF